MRRCFVIYLGSEVSFVSAVAVAASVVASASAAAAAADDEFIGFSASITSWNTPAVPIASARSGLASEVNSLQIIRHQSITIFNQLNDPGGV